MTDYPPKNNGEYERPILEVGDVVLFIQKSFNRPYLVTTVYKSGQIEAMALPDEDHTNYGTPGTEYSEGIKEIIDHFTLDKTAECLARAVTSDPTPSFIEEMKRYLQEEL